MGKESSESLLLPLCIALFLFYFKYLYFASHMLEAIRNYQLNEFKKEETMQVKLLNLHP